MTTPKQMDDKPMAVSAMRFKKTEGADKTTPKQAAAEEYAEKEFGDANYAPREVYERAFLAGAAFAESRYKPVVEAAKEWRRLAFSSTRRQVDMDDAEEALLEIIRALDAEGGEG